RLGTRHERVAGVHALRRDDVAPLAVRVEQQRQMSRTIGIVFEPLDDGRNAVLVPPQVYDAIAALVAAAVMARGHTSVAVAPSGATLHVQQRSVGLALVQLGRDHLHDAATAGGGGVDGYDRHALEIPLRTLRLTRRP